jgi:hypothetical protein
LTERKITGNERFMRALAVPGNPTTRILKSWTNVPLLLMRDQDWARGPFVVIGQSDYFMWPLLPPGSLLRLNKKVRTIDARRFTEFERPIYLVEHRNRFYCCHVQRRGEMLDLISHAESPCPPSISIPSAEARVRGQLTLVFRPMATRANAAGAQRRFKP